MKKLMFLLSAVVMLFASSCLNGSGSAGTSSATYYGKLTVTDNATGEVSYTANEASVTVWIPNIIEPKFDFVFNGVKFDTMMPKLNIEIAGIPFTTTISEDETSLNYIFKAENIVPTVGGIEYDKYKVALIEGCVGTVVDITFTIPSKDKTVHFRSGKGTAAASEE